MWDLPGIFVGALVIVFVAIKYWRIIVGVLAALLITAVFLGVQQLMSMAEQPAANAPVQSQVDQARG